MARLRRSDPHAPGYRRVRHGRGFGYRDEAGVRITDAEVLKRISALAIPPAWTDVWISPAPNGHIQAVGTDAAGRRQYLYHEHWRLRRDRVKFDRALELAASLPGARRKVTLELRSSEPTRERALACAFRILDMASLRVGSEQYMQENGSHGLATLMCSHVRVWKHSVRFNFPAKSGQLWESEVTDADLARVVRSMMRDGTERLLAWRDDEGWHPLSSSEINDYVRLRTLGDFTAKDFRTLSGTISAAIALRRLGVAETKAKRDRRVAAAMREVAETLGNTPAMARKSYVDPRVIDRYHSGEVIEPNGSPEAALRRLLL